MSDVAGHQFVPAIGGEGLSMNTAVMDASFRYPGPLRKWGLDMSDIAGYQFVPAIKGAVLFISAAVTDASFYYPDPPREAYKFQNVSETYRNPPTAMQTSEAFAEEIASIYVSLAERQTLLDPDIEAAIFEDIEDLYEA